MFTVMNKIWKINKPIIGMVHLPYLIGQKNFNGMDYVIDKVLRDVKALKNGSIDGLLIENWEDDSPNYKQQEEDKIFAEPNYTQCIALIIKEIVDCVSLPVGINVLPNDYKSAFSIAKLTGARFVQLDVYVDEVKTKYTHSPVEDFKIKLNPNDIIKYRRKINAKGIALFTSIQPKHYEMLDKKKDILTSAKQAIDKKADSLVVTGDWTGEAPDLNILKKVKEYTGDIPIFIGSGLDKNNAEEFMKYADGAIVGTSLKIEGVTENPVDEKRVKQLMKVIHKVR